MTESKPYQLWKECKEFLSYGILNDFLSQLKSKKPFLQIESCQFITYYKQKLQIECVELNEYAEVCDLTNSEGERKEINWAYFQAYDSLEQTLKTIKVSFFEQKNRDILTEKKEDILQLKENLIMLQRNDLHLKVYDCYYLSISEEDNLSQYFVAELEFIQSRQFAMNAERFKEYKSICILNFFKQLGISLNRFHKVCEFANFYTTKKEKRNQNLTVKICPIDCFLYLIELNQSTSQYTAGFSLQYQDIQQKESPKEFDTVLEYEVFHKTNIVESMEKIYPNFKKFHDTNILALLSQHPQFTDFELEFFDRDLISFKASRMGQDYTVKCMRCSNIQEATKIYEQFQKLDNLQFFHPDTQCELIVFDASVYLLSIEKEINQAYYGINNIQKMLAQKNNKLFSNMLELKLFCWIFEKVEQITFEINLQIPISFDDSVFIIHDDDDNLLLNSRIYLKNILFHKKNQFQTIEQSLCKNINFYNTLYSAIDSHFSYSNKNRNKVYQFLKECLSMISVKRLYPQSIQQGNPEMWNLLQKMKQLYAINQSTWDFDDFYFLIDKHNDLLLREFQGKTGQHELQLQKIFAQQYELQICCSGADLFEILRIIDEPSTNTKRVHLEVKQNCNENNQQYLQKFSKIFHNITEIRIDKFSKDCNIFQFIYFLQLSKLKSLEIITLQLNSYLDPIPLNKDIYLLDFISLFERNKMFKRININFQFLLAYTLIFDIKDFPTIVTSQHSPWRFELSIRDEIKKKHAINMDGSYEANIVLKASFNKLTILKLKIQRFFPYLEFENSHEIQDNEIITKVVLTDNHLFNGNQIVFDLIKTQQGSFEWKRFHTEYKQRLYSKCSEWRKSEIKDERSILQIVKEWQINEYHAWAMNYKYGFDQMQRCIHSDYNKFIMKLQKEQENLMCLELDLRYCKNVIHQLNKNDDYLDLKSNSFHSLLQINIHFGFEKEFLTPKLLKNITKNIKWCKRVNQISFINIESNQQKMAQQQFMKISHIVRLQLH